METSFQVATLQKLSKKTILSIVNRTSDLNFYNKFIIISNNEIFEASKNEAINFLDFGSKQ